MSTFCRESAEIEVTFRRGGERALFVVETGSRSAARDLARYFAGMPCETRMIAIGPVVACAVRVGLGAESPFDAMAAHLRDRYALSICEPGFTTSMYRVALQLARDSEGDLHPLDTCSVCGSPDPFPTTLRATGGALCLTANVCDACAVETGGEDAEEACRRLLQKLDGRFAPWQHALLEGRQDGPVWRFKATATEGAAVPVLAGLSG